MGKSKTCGLYIINKEGKLLICHPTNHAPDFWSIPKGKVEEGESFLEAAIRETYEETNINFGDEMGKVLYHHLGQQTYKSKKKVLVGFVAFEEEFAPTLSFTLKNVELKCDSMVTGRDYPENDDFQWVTLEEAAELLHEAQVPFLKDIKAMHENPKLRLQY